MSSKQPSCTIEEIEEPQPQTDTAYDVQLGAILTHYKGDVDSYLLHMLGYLRRKTNFLQQGSAQKRVLEALTKATGSIKAEADAGLKAGFLAKEAKLSAEKLVPANASSNPAAVSVSTVTSPSPAIVPAAGPSGSSSAATAAAADTEPSTLQSPVEELEDEDEDKKDKGLKPNDARGYDHGHYSWGQTLQEVSVSVPVPAGTKAKMLEVVITKTRLKVALKGGASILEGELTEPVKTDDCMWNMEGGVVELTLAKQDGMHWWNAVVKGEPLIDVHKVEPENSKLGDLDAETRQTVEKMMFDQRQKALGRPTSEEMSKQDMLKKFMASHPEMDFSGAKMM